MAPMMWRFLSNEFSISCISSAESWLSISIFITIDFHESLKSIDIYGRFKMNFIQNLNSILIWSLSKKISLFSFFSICSWIR
jgi:hypothetical protein